MSKMSKAIAVLGVVAGLGVAALPLSSYAAGYSVNTSATVKTTVQGAISISVAAEDSSKTLDLGTLTPNGDAKTGKLTVTVSGNADSEYSLTMSATSMSNKAGTASIPAGKPGQGVSAWGYSTDGTTFTAAPVNSTAQLGTKTIGEAGSTVSDVTFGASAAAGQAADEYSSTVTFVATVND